MNEGETVVKTRSKALGIINRMTLAGGIGLITLSLWPGFLIGCWLILAYPLIGVLGLAWLFTVIRAVPRPVGRGQPIPRRQMLIAPIIVITTLGLLKLYIPRRIAFELCMGQFEKHLPIARATTRPTEFDRWLGIYFVDEVASDPRGGVYFRTGTMADMIDLYSFGFVYRPNLAGSPFGNAYYVIHQISRDWYWFEANNDW